MSLVTFDITVGGASVFVHLCVCVCVCVCVCMRVCKINYTQNLLL